MGYFIKLNNAFTCSAAFKGKLKDNKVEIAFFTCAEEKRASYCWHFWDDEDGEVWEWEFERGK